MLSERGSSTWPKTARPVGPVGLLFRSKSTKYRKKRQIIRNHHRRGADRAVGRINGSGARRRWPVIGAAPKQRLTAADGARRTDCSPVQYSIAVFSVLADRRKNNLQSEQLLIGREHVSGPMDGGRASVQHSCSRQDRTKLGRLQYWGAAPPARCPTSASASRRRRASARVAARADGARAWRDVPRKGVVRPTNATAQSETGQNFTRRVCARACGSRRGRGGARKRRRRS